MADKQPETRLDMARRHVGETEARVARQQEVLLQINADRYPDAAATAQQVLVTMEGTLSALHAHLRIEEQR
jgi:hypothetical protein